MIDDHTSAATQSKRAIAAAKEKAQGAARRTVEGIENNPLSVLVGGIAVGVLAGALLPRTERESAMLGPVGKKITEGAIAAAKAARDAGTAELVAAGISREAARDQASKLLDGVIKAVKTAGDAASKATTAEK